MTEYKRVEVPENVPLTTKLIIQLNAAEDTISNYDYIGVKIAMGVATIEDYAEEIEYTESIRAVIRDIQRELKEAQNEETEELSE